jgi:hypothetical protein
MQDHDMGKWRSLFEYDFPLFEMNLEPVTVEMVEFVFLQKVKKDILAKTMFAIKAFIIIYKVWHCFSPLKKNQVNISPFSGILVEI